MGGDFGEGFVGDDELIDESLAGQVKGYCELNCVESPEAGGEAVFLDEFLRSKEVLRFYTKDLDRASREVAFESRPEVNGDSLCYRAAPYFHRKH